jgi:hypothetical protein
LQADHPRHHWLLLTLTVQNVLVYQLPLVISSEYTPARDRLQRILNSQGK